ncbi:MAG TPA: hypothetical protein PK680_07050 [Novosphingobium sp.]|nr:hypothetical protein [Novosphingobium sp.]HQA18121.1 hypothetical protein [Novosphingobium sp.]
MRSALLAGLVLLAGCQGKLDSSPGTPATGHTDQHLQAFGTEPFWSLEVLPGSKLRYSSPENLDGTIFTVSETNDGSRLRYVGTLDGKAAVLTIEPGECNDGMSDEVFAHKASFNWGEQTEQGCARIK